MTCPLTQNGCIQVLSQPNYPNPINVREAMAILRTSISDPYHQFIPDDISILDDAVIDVRRLSGHRQLSDVYLLALAVRHDARLATLDTRIPLTTVRGATEERLVVL